jgi:triacylglycerol lipase
MSPDIFYSALKDDLYFPCKRSDFFSAGIPKSEEALCAEVARLAYCRQASNFAFDQDKIRRVLGDVGFAEFQFFESKKDPTGQGTHAFLALKRDANKNQQLAIVAFRGTDKDDPTDIGDDADAILVPWENAGNVHQGFAKALGEVRTGLDAALRFLKCKVLFTGHSLGAALATLLASTQNPNLLCTFGSPRVGDSEFAAVLVGVENRRFVDCCDVVPRLPPQLLGYEHVGDPYYIDSNRHITFNPSDGFMLEDKVRAEESYLARYAWKIGNVGVRDLADHAPINYVSSVVANQPVNKD